MELFQHQFYIRKTDPCEINFFSNIFPFLLPWPNSETLIFHPDHCDSLPDWLPVPKSSLPTDPAHWHHKNNPPVITTLLKTLEASSFLESFDEIPLYFFTLLFPVPSTYYASVTPERCNLQNSPCTDTSLLPPKKYLFQNIKHLPIHYFQKFSPTFSILWNLLLYASITSHTALWFIFMNPSHLAWDCLRHIHIPSIRHTVNTDLDST